LPAIIYQNKINNTIYKVEHSEVIPSMPYFLDCDEDSYLLQGDFPINNLMILNNDNILTKDLYPVVTQDPKGLILMQAYINKESLNFTFITGYAHYFSRSRNRLWKKGEESGHFQKVVSIFYNIDFQFYVYSVEQISNACHTGSYSCFYRKVVDGQIYTL
jgi:phosphoribosyl-AMP cyclohydrolase